MYFAVPKSYPSKDCLMAFYLLIFILSTEVEAQGRGTDYCETSDVIGSNIVTTTITSFGIRK